MGKVEIKTKRMTEIRVSQSEILHCEGLVEAKRDRLLREGYEMHVDPKTGDWVFEKGQQ